MSTEQLALFETTEIGNKTFDEFVEIASIRYISHSMHETVWDSYRVALAEYWLDWPNAAIAPFTAFASFADWMEAVAYEFAKWGASR